MRVWWLTALSVVLHTLATLHNFIAPALTSTRSRARFTTARRTTQSGGSTAVTVRHDELLPPLAGLIQIVQNCDAVGSGNRPGRVVGRARQGAGLASHSSGLHDVG